MDKEFEDLMKKAIDKIKEEIGSNTEKKDINKTIEEINKAFKEDNTTCVLMASNERIIYGGSILDMLALMSSIVDNLNKKIPTEILATSVLAGFTSGKEAKFDSETTKAIYDALKKFI